MRIQHNIMAMNAYRNYNTNTSALSKNLEKLSSGYKINRAGDDAAGLAISEKMRAQITGLNAAQKNVKDGISLVKTAEGAMQEIQDMLNRMDYLATQSANGTYQDAVDRENLQKEVNQLLDEIDRIADSANFNGIKLLDGSLDVNASVGQVDRTAVELTGEINRQAGVTQAVTASFDIDLEGMVFTGGASNAGTIQLTVGGATMTVSISGGTTGGSFEVVSGGATIGTAVTLVNINGATFSVSANGTKLTFTATSDNYTGSTASLDVSNIKAEATAVSGSAIGSIEDIGQGESAWNTAAQNTVDGVRKKPQIEAQVKFTLTEDMIKSGELVIDGVTYTFDDTKTLDQSSGNTIGTKGFGTAGGSTVNDIADKLVKAAYSNTNFAIGHTNGEITIQAKSGTNKDYTKGKYDPDATALTESGWSKGLVSYGKTTAAQKGKPLQLQIGDTSDPFNQLQVKVGDMHRGALGLNGLDISTAGAASKSIQMIKDAINNVSSVRGDLGATQNRLEHTQNNLSVMAENIQDAESTIRDTDVAEEMMSYVKNNILVQSAQAMLAQANQVPQGVLQLLG